MKIKFFRTLYVFGIGGLLMSTSFSYAYAYNPVTTHKPLSEKAVELYNASYPDSALTEQEKQWVAQGSVDEDAPSIRVLHHFYDPINNQGLQGFESSKQWAHDNAMQGLNRFQLGGASGVFTWEEAVAAYQAGDKERAYKILGHIFHLIQDKTVPAHVRQDPHPPFFKDALGGEDPYEHAAETTTLPNIKNLKPFQYNSLDEYFDKVAKYTNTHFLSKDSLGQYKQPSIASVDDEYLYSIDPNGSKYKIAKKRGDTRIFDSGEYDLSDPAVIQDYWSRLAPTAIEANAGVLKLFHDTVGKQTTKDQAQVDGGIFASAFRALANSAKSVTLRTGAELRNAKEFFSFFGANIAPGVVIGSDPNSILPFNATIRSIKLQTTIQAQQSQQQFNQQVTTALANPVYTNSQAVLQDQTEGIAEPMPQQQVQQQEQNKSETPPAAPSSSDNTNAQAQNTNSTYHVSHVIDGDTIVLTNGEHVRYIGINAPEAAYSGQTAECFSAEAKAKNEEFVLNKDVRITSGPDAKDIYGRMLGYIWLGDTLVNQKLIEGGYAYADNYGHPHQYDLQFTTAQNAAKSTGAGLWTQCVKEKQKDKQQDEQKEAEANPSTGSGQAKTKQKTEQTQQKQPTQQQQINTQLVINEVRISSGEFVELYNPSDSQTSLAGYTLAYYPFNRTAWNDAWRVKEFPADATIAAHSYFLIVFGDYSGAANWRASTSDMLGNSAGTLALWSGNPTTSTAKRIDAVGWGNTMLSEGSTAPAPTSNTASISRWPSGVDTSSNSVDFRLTATSTPGQQNIYLQEQPKTSASPSSTSQTQQNTSATPATIVINEIQTGDAEFIELYNTSSSATSLTGHYFAYYSSSRTAWNNPYRVKQFPDGASVPAYSYYLIGLKDFPTTGGNPNSDWQPTSIQLAGTGGTVAIFPFDPQTKSAQDAQAGIIDAVGWGDAKLAEPVVSAAPALAPDAGKSITRNATRSDTNNNAQDFTVTATPTPKQGGSVASSDISNDTSQNSLQSDDSVASTATQVAVDATDDTTTSTTDTTTDVTNTDTTTDSTPPAPMHIVINEIQTDDSEFVELFNPTAQAVDLAGYYFAYYSTGKTSWSDPQRIKPLPATDSIQAGSHYLVGLKGYSASNSNPNSDWQFYTSAQLASPGGTVAIFSQDPTCTSQTPCEVSPIDAVAWGDVTSVLKENTPATAPSSNKSISRSTNNQDTDNNSQDFSQLDTPTPTNSRSTVTQASFSGTPLWAAKYFNSQHTNQSTKNGPAWAANSDAKIKSQVQITGYAYSISQPVIDSEGNAYVTTTLSGSKSSSVYSYDINGSERWHYDIAMPDLRTPALSADSQKIYVVSIGANAASSQGKLYILQTSDGSLVSSVSLGNTWSTNGGSHDASSPVIDTSGNVYSCTLRQCMAFNEGGTILWTTTPDWGQILNISRFAGSSATTVRTPVLDGSNMYLVTRNPNNDFMILAFSLTDGSILWSRNIQTAPTTGITFVSGDPSLDASGILYAPFQTSQSNNGIAAFDTQNGGAYLWKSAIDSPSSSFKEAPVVSAGGAVYSASYQQKKIYLFITQGASKGMNKTVFTVPAKVSSLVVIDEGGRVYGGDEAGNVYAWQKITDSNGNDSLSVIWQYQLDSKVLSLVIGNGLVYAITNSGLMYVLGD